MTPIAVGKLSLLFNLSSIPSTGLLLLRSSSATTGLAAGSTATHAHGSLLRLALYHNCSTTVVVVGVDTSLNVTTTTTATTGITSKVIEETAKPSIVVTTIDAAAARQASVLLLLLMAIGWPPLPPRLLVTRSVLSRALHFAVHLTGTGGPGRRWRRSAADGILGRVRGHMLDALLHAGLIHRFHDIFPQQVGYLV